MKRKLEKEKKNSKVLSEEIVLDFQLGLLNTFYAAWKNKKKENRFYLIPTPQSVT